MRPTRKVCSLVASIGVLLSCSTEPAVAWADEPTEPEPASGGPSPGPPTASDAMPATSGAGAAPSASITPSTASASDARTGPPFRVDPVGNAAVIAVSAGFAGLLDLVMTTGEVRPQQISTTFDAKQLLWIDRGAVSQRIDGNAGTLSNVGLGLALTYALIDPIATGVRQESVTSALVDGALYAETFAITAAVTNLAKIAVRRPRPLAYVAALEHKGDPTYSNADTDSSLSFFSGHTSVTAAMTATATYLAFVRSPKSARPWVTLLAGTALTGFVAFERVRAGKHFPTDVVAGAMAGAGVGILVPHLHRRDAERGPTWFGAVPLREGGGVISVSGLF